MLRAPRAGSVAPACGVSPEQEGWWCAEAAPSRNCLGREHQADGIGLLPSVAQIYRIRVGRERCFLASLRSARRALRDGRQELLLSSCRSPPRASASASQSCCSPLDDFYGAGNSFIQGFQSACCYCAPNPSFFLCLFPTQCTFLARAVVFCRVLREKRACVCQHSVPLAVPRLRRGGRAGCYSTAR